MGIKKPKIKGKKVKILFSLYVRFYTKNNQGKGEKNVRLLPRITESRSVIRATMKRVGADTVLLYRLMENPVPGRTSGLRFMYSLTVTKIDRGGERRQVEYLRDITRSREEALNIFTLVSRGRVFPDNAAEIVSDLISI